MKIETKILDEFLTEARMGEIETCLLQFQDKGLVISAMSLANSHGVDAFLKASAFTEYQAIGNVGVDDLSRLIKVFKRLGKELEFQVEGNLLTAKGKKKELSCELVDEKFIEKPKSKPDLTHVTTFTIPSKDVASFLDDAKMNTDVAVLFETVEGGVKVSNTGKYKFTYNFDSADTKGGEKVKFGKPLLSALEGIKEGELLFNAKSNYPIIVEHKTEHYETSFMIAPLVEKEMSK